MKLFRWHYSMAWMEQEVISLYCSWIKGAKILEPLIQDISF